jgi:hypothetical protein
MSTKPSDVGRFAVDSNDLDATNLTVPLSGQRDTGWTHGQQPPSGIENYLHSIAYRWRKYLSDGALSGDHSIAGKLSVDGNFTTGGGATIARDLAVGGNATVGGTLGVTGTTTHGGDVTLAPGKSVHVSGGGRYRHDTWTVRIPAFAGLPQSSTALWGFFSGGIVGAPLPLWCIPIVLPEGAHITAIRARVQDNASGPTKLTLITTKSIDDTENGFGATGTTSDGSGGWQTLAHSGFSEPVAPRTIYYASVFTFTGTAAGRFAWIEVDYDELAEARFGERTAEAHGRIAGLDAGRIMTSSVNQDQDPPSNQRGGAARAVRSGFLPAMAHRPTRSWS